jgi:hypothetical protein
VIGSISSITNLGADLSRVTNAIASLSGLTNMGVQLDYLTNVIGSISSITNLGADISRMTNAIAALSGLTNMGAQLGYVADTVTTLESLTNMPAQMATLTPLTNMSAQLGTLANTPAQMAMLSNSWASLQSRIGSDEDPSSFGTVFGRLALLDQQLGGVGASVNNAASMARSAKTQASTAAGAASAVKTQLEAAQFSRMLSALSQMRTSLDKTLEQVKGIPDSMSTETLVKSLRESMNKIDEMAKNRGMTSPMGAGEGVEPGSPSDPKVVAKLLNTISETKAMMEAMRLLMDAEVNKPVVEVKWLEGTP